MNYQAVPDSSIICRLPICALYHLGFLTRAGSLRTFDHSEGGRQATHGAVGNGTWRQ